MLVYKSWREWDGNLHIYTLWKVLSYKLFVQKPPKSVIIHMKRSDDDDEPVTDQVGNHTI